MYDPCVTLVSLNSTPFTPGSCLRYSACIPHSSRPQDNPAFLHLLLLATPTNMCAAGKAKLGAAGGLERGGPLSALLAKVLILWPDSGVRIQLVSSPLLCFLEAFSSAAARSFSVLARVLLGSGVSRTLAGCARGFYNPLQRRHWEGVVPGLRTHWSRSAAQQLRQLLAAVSFHHRNHHAFCCS